MGYYMGTTVLAVVTGIILVTTIHPGVVGQEKVGGSTVVMPLQTLIQNKLVSPLLIQKRRRGQNSSKLRCIGLCPFGLSIFHLLEQNSRLNMILSWNEKVSRQGTIERRLARFITSTSEVENPIISSPEIRIYYQSCKTSKIQIPNANPTTTTTNDTNNIIFLQIVCLEKTIENCRMKRAEM